MQKVLTIGEAFSLPNVYLTDDDLKKFGLYVLGNVPQRFSAISAVEGLKLDSESAERLERTNGLRPEARRAERSRHSSSYGSADERGGIRCL